MKFHVFQSTQNHQWYFHLRARNGKIIAQSEGYSRQQNAIEAVRKIQASAQHSRVVIKR